jgi:hypothetical protein
LDDQQFDAFIVHLDELLAQLVALGTRQVTLGERQERINAEQMLTNHRLELLILELIRQRRNGNPN